MPVVNIKGVGPMEFPDSMSQEQIASAIHNDVLPKFPELAAKTNRSWGEAATDIGSSVAKGVGQLAQLPGQIGELTGITKPQDEDTGLQGLGKRLEQFGQESKSTTLKGKEAVRDQKIAAAEGILPEFGTAIKETIKDPALLTSFFAEQLPNLVGSWGGGAIARGATKALMSDAVKSALGAAGVAEKAGEAGVKGAVATNAIMQGADIGSDTYHTVYDQLKKQNPDMDDDQLNGIALAKGRMAAIEAAGISFAATKLPGGTTIEKMLAGKGATNIGAKGVLKGLAEEAASEALEEGGGKFASNVNVQEALPETSLTKGVGSAAGMGALGGGIFGGIAGHVNESNDPAVHAAYEKAIETNTPQPISATLALPYDKNVNAQQVMYVYPDGSMAFPSEANNFMNANAPQASQTALEEKFAPQPIESTAKPITESDIKNMNIGPTNKTIREAILGKDLTDPAQVTEVKTALESYLDQGRSPRITNAVTDFLSRPEFTAQAAPVVEAQAAPEAVTPEPKKRMKKLKPTAQERAAEETPTPDEQAALQAELDAELNQEPQSLEDGNVGKPTTPISGPSESSVRVPSVGPSTTTGAGQTERRGMVPVGDAIGQPVGGEAPVQRALENNVVSLEKVAREKFLSGIAKEAFDGQLYTLNKLYNEGIATDEDYKNFEEAIKGSPDQLVAIARGTKIISEVKKRKQGATQERINTPAANQEQISPAQVPTQILEEPALTTPQAPNLNKRQIKEYEEAAANYMVGRANDAGKINTVQRSLDYVAGDLHSGENLKEAKRFHRGLSEEQKAYVQKKIDELQALEDKDTANRYPIETMQKNEVERLKKQEAKRKIEPEEGPLVERIKQGAKTDALVSAVQRGDLAGALNAISKDTSGTFNILEKLVSNRLLANKGSLPKIEIVPAGTVKGGDAQYNPFTDTVQINEGQVDSHTVLHETVHGFLHTLIEKFEGGAKNKGIADLKGLYDFIKENHPNVAQEYGMKNLTEFASELMSNRDFQQTLAQIPYRVEHQSLFTAFVRAVLNALGLSPTQKLSALARGLMAADQSLAQGRNVQQMRTGVETGPAVKVNREDLAANYKATGAEQRAKPTEETGPFQTIKDTVKSKESAKQGLSRFLNTAETMLFSSDAALNNAIRKELESGGKSWDTIKKMMFENSTAQASHADAVAMQFLQHGGLEYDPKTYKWKAEDDVKNSWSGMVHQLADIAKKNGLTTEEVTNYAQQAFVAERLKGLSKADKDVYSHMTPAQIEAGIKFFEMIPELRELQKTWNAVRKNAMDVAVKGGLYNEKQAEKLLDIMDYVPFYRIEQLAQNAGPKEYGRGLIDFAKNYKIEGSEQEVANIFDNMERWTSYTVSRAVKNRTAVNLYDTAKSLFPDEVRDLRQDERVKREQNTIDLWVDGNRRKVEFKDPLFVHAFNGIESMAIPHFGIMSSIANILRKNIVLMPLFSISQLSQDSFGAMLTSGLKHPWLLPLEVAKEFTKTLMGRSTTAEELAKYGATGVRDYSATFVRDSAEILAGLKQDTKSGAFKRALEHFAMSSDNAVRQAIYNMTMKETGGDKATAVERAFEIINFKRAGASGKIQMLRQVVPFFGAYLQAQNVIYKTLSGKGISPQQRSEALKTLAGNTLKIGALAFAYAALCADDDEYQKMDPQIRDHHLLIPGTSFMLPLRQDLTLMPKLIAEYAYLGMTDNSFTDGKKIRRAMSNSLSNAVMSPTAVPQAFKPILEVATNHDFFTGRSIIGQGIAGKVTEEQYTATTSELAKFIGSSGLIAPVNVDHLIKGYLGTTGGLGLQMTNAVVNGSNGVPAPAKSWQDAIASTPGLSAFVAKEYGNADKNDYYELRDEVSKASTTFNAMKKEGRVADAKEFLEENKDLLKDKVKTQVNNINNELTKIREREKQIYAAPESKMNAEKKGEEIKRIREREKKLLSNVHKLRQQAGY